MCGYTRSLRPYSLPAASGTQHHDNDIQHIPYGDTLKSTTQTADYLQRDRRCCSEESFLAPSTVYDYWRCMGLSPVLSNLALLTSRSQSLTHSLTAAWHCLARSSLLPMAAVVCASPLTSALSANSCASCNCCLRFCLLNMFSWGPCSSCFLCSRCC